MVKIEQIIAVGNRPGLFKLVASKPNGLILEDLATGKTNFYSSRTYQFSPLESIGIYTLEDNLPLKDVYQRFLSNEEKTPIPPDNDADSEIKNYFELLIPEYDRYRVHARDMRKCIRWYRQLKSMGYIDHSEDPKKTQD